MTSRPPLPEWVAHSSPGPNQPLVPRVERLARGVRAAAAAIAPRVELPFHELYRPTRMGLGFTLADHDVALRSAWAVVGEWLVAASVQAPCAEQGLRATHEWFWQGSGRALGVVPDVDVVVGVQDAVELRALLPYVLDPMAAATRRDVISSHSTVHERRTRKAAGVYYTPGDVAYSMVERLMFSSKAKDLPLWFDPAHGSGVFLRAVYCALGAGPGVTDRIYGVDLDPMAAETASFVLTAEDLVNNLDAGAPWERWHRFRRNLATGDALMIDTVEARGATLPFLDDTVSGDGWPLGSFEPWRLESAFPEMRERSVGRVVANPPYAPLRRAASSVHVPRLHPVTGRTTSADISPAFVELCTNLLSDDGALAIVLPLSVVASSRSPFPELREWLASQPGQLEFLSFDRVPDALFGDDIKTRNSIVHLNRTTQTGILASPLYRWTSRTRASSLRNVPMVSVKDLPGVPHSIPKIGNDWERALLLACGGAGRYMDQWATRRHHVPLGSVSRAVGDEQSDVVALAPTAYNFLGVMRDPYRALIEGHDSQNAFAMLKFNTEVEASAGYALLNCRLAFWLWHVTGDGFHVTGTLNRRLPVPTVTGAAVERLAELGDRLWKEALQSPVISTNRGRQTVAYPTWPYADLINDIDAEVERLVGVEFSVRLAEWHRRLIVVDIHSERRSHMVRKTQ